MPATPLRVALLSLLAGALALAVVAFAQLYRTTQTLQRMANTRMAIDDVQITILEAETAERGYVITGRADYLGSVVQFVRELVA
jgi:CHASE3 domain sensor protein